LLVAAAVFANATSPQIGYVPEHPRWFDLKEDFTQGFNVADVQHRLVDHS
jgi:hypothetical protein